jgi:hypothetical protein
MPSEGCVGGGERLPRRLQTRGRGGEGVPRYRLFLRGKKEKLAANLSAGRVKGLRYSHGTNRLLQDPTLNWRGLEIQRYLSAEGSTMSLTVASHHFQQRFKMQDSPL